MNLSLKEVGGSVLIISQFTLCAELSRGRRPSFKKAKSPSESKILYEEFILLFKKCGVNVQTGQFGKFMNVKIINNGPSTFIFNSRKVTLFKTPYIWQDNHNYEVKSVFINLSTLWIVR